MYRIRNERKVRDYIKKHENILLYGTGNVARITYDILKEWKVFPVGFVVSPGYFENCAFGGGISTYNILNLPENLRKAGILLTVNFNVYYEVLKVLETAGIKDYMMILLEETPALEITTKIGCSVNCKYCPQSKLVKKYYSDEKNRLSTMGFENFKNYLSQIPKYVEIIFSGMCEPFLNLDCSKMMHYAYENGYKLGLATTLVGLQKRDFDIIKDIDYMWIVLHMPDCQGNTNIVVTEEYLDNLEMFISMKEKMITKISCHGDMDKRCSDLISSKYFCGSSLYDRAGNLDNEDLKHYYWNKPIFCSRSSRLNTNVLLPDGTITLCCMDYGLQSILGNLTESTYKEILSAKTIKNIMSTMAKGEECICQYCLNAVEIEQYKKYL